ncbi:DMT family transporter [Enterovibrio paralichthyis]|uniref:DMT family transporter n=1 Tax=Enterovibrio paralichthyis TaxID=2853805 RepID=UPI001C45B76A|nr:DMT family transporter [Enterovibrio paralichthyis]MBV7297373.1 DMT family transporter [Enterovibrio paralichthyis]
MFKRAIPFIFVLLWSTGFIGAKFGLPYADAATFLFIRMVLNVLVFAVILAVMRPAMPKGKTLLHVLASGLMIHGFYLGGVFAAISYGMPAGLSSLLVGFQPILTALIVISLSSERLNIAQWLGLVAGIVGIGLVVQGKMSWNADAQPVYAYLFVFSALIGITLGTLYQKHFCQGVDLVACAMWQYVAAGIFFLPLAWLVEGFHVTWSLTFILTMAWSVLALSVVAVLLYLYMVGQGAASKVTSVIYLVPPVTAIQGWLFFDEAFSTATILGFAVCALAVFLVMRAPKLGKAS